MKPTNALGLSFAAALLLALPSAPPAHAQDLALAEATAPAPSTPAAGPAAALPLHYGLPALRRPMPRLRYPERARLFRREGTVVATFVVDAAGRAREAAIVQGFFRECEAEVLRVLGHARFAPVRDAQGRPVPARVVAAFEFRLDDE